MKILNVESIRKADAYTIENEPISSIDLMERAAGACVDFVRRHFLEQKKIAVVAGPGNNGGDGLVMARLLADAYEVQVYIPDIGIPTSEDFAINFNRLKQISKVKIFMLKTEEDLEKLQGADLWLDALFGSGLNRPVQGFLGKLIEKLNQQDSPIVSIDIPSGMFADRPLEKGQGSVVHAAITLSLQLPKLMMLLSESAAHVGDLHIIPIGLHPDFLANEKASAVLVDEEIVRLLHRKRPKFTHKGWAGHALLIAGSADKPGAAILAAGGALRAGVGLLTVHGPHAVTTALLQHFPEAMLSRDEHAEVVSQVPDLQKYSVVGIGPGLGTEKESAHVLKLLIQNASQPLVFDADALNLLSEHKTWMGFLPPNSILTPHPGEFDRLAGLSTTHFERIQKQVELSKKHQLYIVLKGAHSSISCPDGTLYFNNTGNPGMATGGSGDVLTGIIIALIAQGYAPHDASILAVWMHGLAGDMALQKQSVESLIARDIIEHLGEAFGTLGV